MGDELGYGAVQGHSRVDGLVVVADVESWLLDSDPALRWQVERDVSGDLPSVWEATRARIAKEGFGARLLALQDPDGRWAGGAFFPAGFDFADVDDEGQPWTATTWALNDLREWGLDPAVLRERRTAELLADSARWEYDDLPYWGGEVDCCINAWTVANGVWLGADITGIVDWFLDHRLPDGGWNCEWIDGSRRSSSYVDRCASNHALSLLRARSRRNRKVASLNPVKATWPPYVASVTSEPGRILG